MIKTLAAALVAVLGASLLSAQSALVCVVVPDEVALRRLIAADLDIAPHEPSVGEVEIILHAPADWTRLGATGLAHAVVHADLQAWYRSRLRTGFADTFPALGSGSMGGYFTFDEAIAAMDCLVTAYPALVAPKVSLGLSHEGRPLWMYKVSDNVAVDEREPEVEIDAWHHAREPGTFTSLYHFLVTLLAGYGTDADSTSLIDERELYVIPCVNPDGVVYNQATNPGGGGLWRKNRRDNGNGSWGVDLNRNYPFQWGYDDIGSSPATSSEIYRGPAPLSEPEILALTVWAATRTISVAQNAHTYGNLHLHPFGYASGATSPSAAAYQEIGARMAALNGYRVGATPQILYLANGGSTDWWEGALGALAFTTEMGSGNDGFWPPAARILPIAEDNLRTFREWCWFAGSNVLVTGHALAQVSGDGDPWPEPGEVFDILVTLRNLGRLATGGAVTASIAP